MRSVLQSKPVQGPRALNSHARVIPERDRQSARQIRDRVWQAKIHKVERIEEEDEDYVWGLNAERATNDPSDESVPWELARRELGLDRK